MKGILVIGALALVGSFAHAADMADASVSANVMAANDAEIQAGKLAESKATNAEVKAFAKHMVDEHTKNDQQATALDQKLKVTPQTDATVDAMKADAKAKIDALSAKSGAAFDKGYMDLQVAMHEQVLSQINGVLLPKAQNAEMKKFLTTTKTHVQDHLAMAKKIQSTLK